MADSTEVEYLQKKIAQLEHQVDSCKRLIDNSSDLFYWTDLEGRITRISPSVQRLSGYTVDEAIGMNIAEEVYLNPEERQVFLKLLNETGNVTGFEAALLRKDGSVWQASTNAQWLTDSNGSIVGVQGITRDVSELKATISSLTALEERFRLAFHTNPDAIAINWADSGVYIDVNEGFIEQTGYTREEVIGKSSFDISIWDNPNERARLLDALCRNGFVKNLEARFRMRDGSVHVGLTSARFLTIDNRQCILSITRNIAELKAAEKEKERLEAELAQSQKMEAIGRLAGGIAHDLNNQLVPILGYADMLQRENGHNRRLRSKLNVMAKAAEAARDLVHQLLAFGRKQTLAYKNIDLNELLKEFETLFRRTIREDIEIRLQLAPYTVGIQADPGQMKQVIMNLVVNAVDAMPRGGVLTIETSRCSADENDMSNCGHPQWKTGSVLTITDTGEGMDDATRQRIFEPFFSTKGDHGTGLGLSTVYGIIRQHEGDIQVTSEPGQGTAFKISLPFEWQIDDNTDTAISAIPDAHAGDVVCLVEDNDMVRELTQEVLEDCGYRVIVATTGKAALEKVADEPRIDLLLTDVVMPGLNGTELSSLLCKRFPSMKVLYMSGYPDDIISQRASAQSGAVGGVAFIQKPFTPVSLLAEVRRVLDE